jgi:hypothetical protein
VGPLTTAGVGAVVGCLAVATPASAATQLGETFAPTEAAVGNSTLLQTLSPQDRYAAPFAGIITSWSHLAGPGQQKLELKLARPAGGGAFEIVGQSEIVTITPNAMNTFSARIVVQPGDLLGVYAVTNAPLTSNQTRYADRIALGDPQAGMTSFFAGPFDGVKLDLAATLEHDCDGDELGDETQDPELSGPECFPDLTPPNTKILTARTGRRRVTFKFGSNEHEGAVFMCRLDGHPYQPCQSPRKFRVTRGAHAFRVYAIDAAGNADPTPAVDRWHAPKG